MLKKQSAKHTQNRALEWQNFCCYFFATPTRLADGLGTKKYPRVYLALTLRPGFTKNENKIIKLLVPPRCLLLENNFGDQLFNKINFIIIKSLDSRKICVFFHLGGNM
ncbi:MAG: hypothetical protein JWN60_822 [Acidobacteria bacterium]|jgi:hypothetical protein|nr:hypothetical protein [Acidobacteriota bacterium]